MFESRDIAERDGIAPVQRLARANGHLDVGESLDHSVAPYLEALRAYGGRDPGRYHVPGHKGGAGTDPELRQVLGEAFTLDVPLVIHGVDVGVEETPLERPLELCLLYTSDAADEL